MSHAAFSHVRDNSRAKGSAKSVLLMIADRANNENGWKCYPGITRLARETGYSERTVRKAVRTAIELGELRVLRRGGFYSGKGQANVYQIVSDFHLQDSPVEGESDTDHRQISPVDQRQDSPVVDEIGTHHRQNLPPLPAHSVSPPADSAPPPADLAAQPLVEPEAKEPEDKPEELTPQTPLETGDALSPAYRTFIEKCRNWNDDQEPENSGQVEEEFTSLLEEGFTVSGLVAAYQGAIDTGTTDLTEILVADRIDDFAKASPMAVYRRKSAA